MKLIALTRGQVAKVDDSDFEWLNQWKWHANRDPRSGKFYAVRRKGARSDRSSISMHRLLLGITDRKIQGDHRNGDSLDNQRFNLRAATNQQNAFNVGKFRNNTSGFKGVSFARGKWHARIQMNGRSKFLGSFDSPVSAAMAYKAAAQQLHGEFIHQDVMSEIEIAQL